MSSSDDGGMSHSCEQMERIKGGKKDPLGRHANN